MSSERPVTLDKSLDDIIAARDEDRKKPKQEKRGDKEKKAKSASNGAAKGDKGREGKGGAVKPKGKAGREGREDATQLHKKGPRGGAGAARKERTVSVASDGDWKHDKFAGAAVRRPVAEAPKPAITLGTRVLITNLDHAITAEDLRDIFGRVGELRTVAIHYDAHNKPRGAAEVVYRNRASAETAVAEFDGRQVDETKIRVKIIDGDAPAGPAASGAGEARKGRGFAESNPTFKVTASQPPRPGSAGKHADAAATSRTVVVSSEHQSPSGGRGGRGGRGGSRGGGRGGRAPSGKVTHEDLDKELEAYAAKA